MQTVLTVLGVIYCLLGLICVRAARRGLREVDICDGLRKEMSIPAKWLPFLRPVGDLLPSRIGIYLRAFFIAPLGCLYVQFFFLMVIILGLLTGRHPAWAFPVMLAPLRWFLGFRVIVKGEPEVVPLYALNHSGIFDPPIMASAIAFITFVAKSDVRKLPIIGKGLEIVNTIFVNRADADDRKAAVDAISTYLESWTPAKPSVVIFPEGTTTNNEYIIPFKTGAFQTRARFQPVRIEYPNHHCSFACSASQFVPIVTCFSVGGGDVLLTFFPSTARGENETPDEAAERTRRIIAGDKLSLSVPEAGYRSHVEVTHAVQDRWKGKSKQQ